MVSVTDIFLMQISVSVVHSDYHPDNSRIEKTALIEFILLSATENCSLSQDCDFEGECEEWSVGGGVRLVKGAEAPVQTLSSNQGSYVYTLMYTCDIDYGDCCMCSNGDCCVLRAMTLVLLVQFWEHRKLRDGKK